MRVSRLRTLICRSRVCYRLLIPKEINNLVRQIAAESGKIRNAAARKSVPKAHPHDFPKVSGCRSFGDPAPPILGSRRGFWQRPEVGFPGDMPGLAGRKAKCKLAIFRADQAMATHRAA
jgi:hypothetical protein